MDKLIDDFINSLNRRPTTKDTYRKALREFSKWLGDVSPHGLTSEDIQRYKDYILSRNLSSTSMSAYLTAVRRLYDYLISIDRIRENPARKIKGGARPKRHLTKALSRKEANKLLSVIDASTKLGRRDRAILAMMVMSGLGEIEIVRSNVGDLNTMFGKNVIFVQGKNKDRKDEYVVLHEESRKAVESYLAGRGKTEAEEPLFWGVGNKAIGGRITTRAIRSRINYYLEESGIKREGITPSSLRHTAAFLAIEQGATPAQIKDMLRLKTLDSALIYFEEAKERARVNNVG